MDEAQLQRWLDEYGLAWQERDPEAAANLFAADAVYRETPFEQPLKGRAAIRDYWAQATGPQSAVRFSSEPISVAGQTGVALWQSSFERAGSRVELDGVFRLTFDERGLCSELREWWHARMGDPPRRPSPEGPS